MNCTSMRKIRAIAAVLLVLALLLPAAAAWADPKDMEHIRAAIKARGGKWVAGTTSVSELSLDEKKKRAGLDIEAELAAPLDEWNLPLADTATTTPATHDWRSINGISYVSPVKNQGSCGSCWAFAVAAGLESQVMLFNGGTAPDVSEQILVSCSGAGSCAGGVTSIASNFVRDVGLPLETCYPYTFTNGVCENGCVDWRDSTYGIIGWHAATTTTITVDDIKQALYLYGPVVLSMYVYNDFYAYRSGVYSYTTGAYVGGHAVLAVGYDDINQCFIVKNSWGTGWGEAGYFRIAYSEVGGSTGFGRAALVYEGYENFNPGDISTVTAAIDSPSAGATVSGSVAVAASSTSTDIEVVEMYLDGVLTGTDATAPYTFPWDTTRSANGAHTLEAVAYNSTGGSGSSGKISVNVSNAVGDTTPPTAAIVSPAANATLSKMVKVKVSAKDNAALARVEVYYNGSVLIGASAVTGTAATVEFPWNTIKVAKGPARIKAVTRDAAGLTSTTEIGVTLK